VSKSRYFLNRFPCFLSVLSRPLGESRCLHSNCTQLYESERIVPALGVGRVVFETSPGWSHFRHDERQRNEFMGHIKGSEPPNECSGAFFVCLFVGRFSLSCLLLRSERHATPLGLYYFIPRMIATRRHHKRKAGTPRRYYQ